MFPGPAIFVLFVTSQIYIHLSSSSYALTARDAIERALGRGVMKGLGQLILGIVGPTIVRSSRRRYEANRAHFIACTGIGIHPYSLCQISMYTPCNRELKSYHGKCS